MPPAVKIIIHFAELSHSKYQMMKIYYIEAKKYKINLLVNFGKSKRWLFRGEF